MRVTVLDEGMEGGKDGNRLFGAVFLAVGTHAVLHHCMLCSGCS